MEGVGHSLAMGEVTLKPLLEDARRYIPVYIRLLEYVFVSYLQGIGFIETLLVVSQ